MKFIVVLPDHRYYLWQMLVQINNFKRLGIEKDTTYVIGTFNNRITPQLQKFINSKDIEAKIVLYPDRRQLKRYSSSLRPYLLMRFFIDNPSYGDTKFMYLDPDVLFTKQVDFTQFERDFKWYVSDTRSYIDSKYIRSKGEDIFKKMCDIVEINEGIVITRDNNAGGAQYIMNHVDYKFWEKVYFNCESMFTEVKIMSAAKKLENPEYHELQIWCADMWSLLWNGWYFNHQIEIHPQLDFAWASSTIDKWDSCNIFHNAGVPAENGKDFCKSTYQLSPFNLNFTIAEDNIGIKYVNEIKDTEKNFKDLIY